MATKVNRDYWSGTINYMSGFPNADDVGYLGGQLVDLINNDTWDIANNDEFDLSVCPWGIPECSVSSMSVPTWVKDDDNKLHINFDVSKRKNMPVFFNRYVGRHTTDTYSMARARTDNKQRVVGNTEKSTLQYIKYNTTIDVQNNVELEQIKTDSKPIVSLNYQSIRQFIGGIFLYDMSKTDNYSNVSSVIRSITELKNLKNVDGTSNKYRVSRIANAICSKLDSSLRLGFHMCGKTNIPEYLQSQYYDDDVKEYIDLSRNPIQIGQSQMGVNFGVYGTVYFNGISRYGNSIPTLKTTKSIDYGCSMQTTCINNASPKKQVFSDVSYHWEMHCFYYTGGVSGNGTRYERKEGFDLNINSGNSYSISNLLTLEIDSSIYDNYYDAAAAAILHEMAFVGVPFVTNDSDFSEPLNSNKVYIPVFDYEHMMTTGEYKRGDEASDLPNFTWNDIFDTSVPAYDPNYIPPEPEPEESDYGDTSNLGSARGLFPAGVNIYLMSRLDYNTFMGELNSYYANSTPDDWTLDFQGVNPSDYILNVYYTPYNFVKSENKAAVKIGNIELTTTAYELSQGSPGVDDPNKWKYFTYGTRTVTPLFNDFRDYDPYTKVELYLPLAGTVELDTNYVMNHDITVEYYFDLMTMSGVAAVYRDSMLYKTSDFKLGAQVPLLITNMGQIQNQITQLEFSQKQNNLRLATSAISSGVSIGTILAGGGEVSTGQAIGAAGGTFALASGIMKADEIDYQLKHTSPSVSVTGAAEPLNNYSVGQLTPKLIIKRPLMLNTLDNAIYSKTIGNSCCINTTLDSMSGLVVCSSIDTTGIQKEISTGVYISPTIDEVNMIKSTFGSGVIL